MIGGQASAIRDRNANASTTSAVTTSAKLGGRQGDRLFVAHEGMCHASGKLGRWSIVTLAGRGVCWYATQPGVIRQAGQLHPDRAGSTLNEPGQRRDFFISYTQANRAWAEWIAWELETAGYSTLLQAWDMPAGTSFVQVMNEAVQETRHTLIVLSPAYLRSQMAQAEWRAGFVEDPSGTERRLVPVRIEACEVQGLLADRVYLDLVGADESTARAKLHEGIVSAVRGHSRPASRPRFPLSSSADGVVDQPWFPSVPLPVWNVPFQRNLVFTGREEIIEALASQQRTGGAAVVSQFLQGMGGVGKTALTVEYAWRQRASFDVVWWVRAEDPTTLVGDYAGLAVALGLARVGMPDQLAQALAVRHWLEQHDRWLLVFDNADRPDTSTGLRDPLARMCDLLPRIARGQVLITSRDLAWEQHAALTELEVFTPDEASAFLLTRSGSADAAAASQIAALLGWLPLALEQAGAYARETKVALATYLDRLRLFPTLTLRKGQSRDRDPADTVASIWQVSLERVRPVPGAPELLEVCAFLAAEEVPRDLFAQALEPPAEELAVLTRDPFALDDAIGALHRFGLLKATENGVTVHRLLQQVVRDHLEPAVSVSRAGLAVQLLANAFPWGHEDPAVWPTCASLLPHAITAVEYAERYQAGLSAASILLDRSGSYLDARGSYTEARALAERALALAEIVHGPEDVVTAVRLNNLATLEHAQGNLDTARALHERALAIREEQLGSNHPTTAGSLNNLATVLRDQGDLDSARSLQERALTIHEAHFGSDHPTTAWSLNNLATILHGQGDLDSARSLHERALTIHEAHFGSDHPTTARSLNHLATVLRDQGALDIAAALHERALTIRQTWLGSDHPDAVRTRQDLAVVRAKLANRERPGTQLTPS